MDRARPYLLGMYEKSMPLELSWEEKLNACKKAGFDWIEISIDETDEKIARLSDRRTIEEIKDAIRKTGVPILTMCFSAQRKYSLGSLGKEKHEKAMEIMEKAVDFAADLGIRIIQLAGYDCYYEESNEETRAEFIKNLKIAAHPQLAVPSGAKVRGISRQCLRRFLPCPARRRLHKSARSCNKRLRESRCGSRRTC